MNGCDSTILSQFRFKVLKEGFSRFSLDDYLTTLKVAKLAIASSSENITQSFIVENTEPHRVIIRRTGLSKNQSLINREESDQYDVTTRFQLRRRTMFIRRLVALELLKANHNYQLSMECNEDGLFLPGSFTSLEESREFAEALNDYCYSLEDSHTHSESRN